jgi:hypothetical protein
MARIPNPQNHWSTPQALYDLLDRTYKLDGFDPCPICNDIDIFDGLAVPWPDNTFCNPPYDLVGKTKFVKKALQESSNGKTVVMLLPVSTSTKLFHEVILPNAEITFLDYRPAFEGINNRGEWVNAYTGKKSANLTELQSQWEEQGLKKVKSPGAHDSMIVTFWPQ